MPRPLPRYTQPFVGRREALEALVTLLTAGAARLVTLLGPAGSGKTRMAMEAAARVVPDYEGSVHRVDLRTLERGRLGSHVARALDLRAEGPAALARALEALGPTLLVLDEAEGHLAEVATWLPRILAATATTRILATSRVALALRDEHVMEVHPLEKPGTVEELATSEAGRLFLTRLAARNGSITAEERGQAVQLLGRLGDLPLVVELLAAQVALFGTGPLMARVDHALDWLETDARDEPRPSLRYALDASYTALGERERRVLFGCALFAGPFDAADVEAVCGDDATLFPVLRRLRSSSWLTATRARFELLATLREYIDRARDATCTPDEVKAMRTRHAQRVLARALGPASLDATDRHELATALRFAVGDPALHGPARDALHAAFGSFSTAGALQAFVDLALPLVDAADAPIGWAHLAVARAMRDLGAFDAAVARLEVIRAHAVSAGDEGLRAAAGSALASLWFKAGRYDRVETQHASATPSDRPEEVEAFATAAAIRGDPDAAIRTYVVALATRERALRAEDRAVLHACFARLLAELGRHERAQQEITRAWEASTVLPRVVGASLTATQAMIAHDRGRFDEAIACYDDAMARYAAPTAPIATYLAFVRALATLQAGKVDAARAAFRAARALDNTAMTQLKPLVALGDWVVEGIAPPDLALDDGVVQSTYRLFSTWIAGEQGADVAVRLRDARAHHEPATRWSAVSRACLRLTYQTFPTGHLAADALLVGADDRWFAPPGGRVVSIAHRPLLQRALSALTQARLARAGGRLTIDEIAAHVWPGERMSSQSRKNRVYVAMSSLRVMGLGPLIDGTSGGYRLDPAVGCERR